MLYGVREHSKRFYKEENDVPYYSFYDRFCCYKKSDGPEFYPAWSFEAFVVKWADEIAQRHHDIEDAYIQGLLAPKDIIALLESFKDKLVLDDRLREKFTKLRDDMLTTKNVLDSRIEHNLSSFIVDTYVSIIIDEFKNFMGSIADKYGTHDRKGFIDKYLEISENEIREGTAFKTSSIYKADKSLGNSLRDLILLTYPVQRLDGKGNFVIRKIIRAYLSNPQQLPDDYIFYYVTREMARVLKPDELSIVMNYFEKELSGFHPKDIKDWKIYTCRQAIDILFNRNDEKEAIDRSNLGSPFNNGILYIPLLRIIYDYIASMTDVSALTEYQDLY